MKSLAFAAGAGTGLCVQDSSQARFARFSNICVFRMACLILVCGLYLAAAAVLESRLSLNTLIERAVMIFSLAAGLLAFSVQVLSLVACLNGRGLIIAGIATIGLAWGVSLIQRTPADRASWKKLLEDANAGLTVEKGRWFVLTLLLLANGLTGLSAVAGVFMIPLGDPYHFEMPLFWMQNQSLEPFITHDPRITCTSFVGEALGLPGFVFCKSGVLWLAVVWVAGILSLGVIFSLARRLGCSLRAAAVTAVLPLGIRAWQQYFIEADAAMCLAGLWAGAGLLFLMRCGDAVECSGELLTRLGCSVFCLILGCGAKNTTIFLAPFFLPALAAILRRRLLEKTALKVLAAWGLAAVLCSGVLWNYAWNCRWYGNISGPPSLQEHLSGDRSLPAVWTRCCRDAVLFVFDTTWLPNTDYQAYQAVCQKTVRLLGGKPELAEDEAGLFNFRNIGPGLGIGLIGPLLVLPAFFYGAFRFWRRKHEIAGVARSSGFRDFWLLLLVVAGYSFLCHVFLRSQNIGLWRLMPAFPVLAAPVCGLLLEKRWHRIAVLTLAGLCALVPVSSNLVMMGNRFATDRLVSELENNSSLQNFFSRIGKRPTVEVECQWGNEAPQKALLHEPYNSREIALMFLQRARHPAVIAFAGGFLSDAYYFFGPDFSNRIVPLVDCRHPEQLLDPPVNADYLVFPQNSAIDPVKQNAWALRHGYRPFFRVDQQDQCLFLSFQKSP
jgi:hypothetical protein